MNDISSKNVWLIPMIVKTSEIDDVELIWENFASKPKNGCPPYEYDWLWCEEKTISNKVYGIIKEGENVEIDSPMKEPALINKLPSLS